MIIDLKFIRIEFIYNIHYSDNGYLQIPLGYISIGSNDFVITILLISFIFSWGDALKLSKEKEVVEKYKKI